MEQNRRARIVKRASLYKRIIDAPEDYLTKVENDLRALDWDLLQEGFRYKQLPLLLSTSSVCQLLVHIVHYYKRTIDSFIVTQLLPLCFFMALVNSWPLAIGLNVLLTSVKMGYWLDDPLANVPAVLKQDRPYYYSKSMRPGFATLVSHQVNGIFVTDMMSSSTDSLHVFLTF